MSDPVGNHIVGFPTRRLIYLGCYSIYEQFKFYAQLKKSFITLGLGWAIALTTLFLGRLRHIPVKKAIHNMLFLNQWKRKQFKIMCQI